MKHLFFLSILLACAPLGAADRSGEVRAEASAHAQLLLAEKAFLPGCEEFLDTIIKNDVAWYRFFPGVDSFLTFYASPEGKTFRQQNSTAADACEGRFWESLIDYFPEGATGERFAGEIRAHVERDIKELASIGGPSLPHFSRWLTAVYAARVADALSGYFGGSFFELALAHILLEIHSSVDLRALPATRAALLGKMRLIAVEKSIFSVDLRVPVKELSYSVNDLTAIKKHLYPCGEDAAAGGAGGGAAADAETEALRKLVAVQPKAEIVGYWGPR